MDPLNCAEPLSCDAPDAVVVEFCAGDSSVLLQPMPPITMSKPKAKIQLVFMFTPRSRFQPYLDALKLLLNC